MGTFQEKSSQTYWSVVERLPLESSQLVCWKFCCTLHKILQDGHPNVLHESMNHKDLLINTGKTWGRVPESYGTLISSYCNFLVTKLEFHRNNPQFPGQMSMNDELESFCKRDVENW
jgi:ANTH domain